MRRAAVRGLNHLTLSVPDVVAATAFYTEVLGLSTVATWPSGAYLSAGRLWLALVDRAGYSHLALDVDREDFAALADRVRTSGAEIWQDNRTEGDSLYFKDPAGNALEIHATDLYERLQHPWDGLHVVPDATRLATAQPTVTASGGRRFATTPVGVFVFVFDADERVLLLRVPGRSLWEVPSGAVEAGETLLEAAVREVSEETALEVRVLGTVHAYTRTYDPAVQFLTCIGFVAEHVSGEVVPGDDAAGAEITWARVGEVSETSVPDEPWLFERALESFRAWRGREWPLQPPRP